MLKLTRYGIDVEIVMPSDGFFTLCVEHKAYLLDVLTDLRNQIELDSEGTFNLLFDNKRLNMSKSAGMISDFVNIDFNSKQITNLLTKKFSEFLALGEQSGQLTAIEGILYNLAEDFKMSSGLNIEYDAVLNFNNIAKICGIKISDENCNFLRRLCEYVDLLCDLKPIKLLVLVFGKQFLTQDDMRLFCRHCCDKNVRLLDIEGVDGSDLLENEARLIIDHDLCTIMRGHMV